MGKRSGHVIGLINLLRGFLLIVAGSMLFAPDGARAEIHDDGLEPLLKAVMPIADTFSEKSGQPPVFEAYQVDAETGDKTLVGYAFLTSDVPPDELGYNGIIEVLVGMDLEGTITGIKVVDYVESNRAILGDFLRAPGVQEQFSGKTLGEPFRVGRDVDGISRATISINAMAREIRNSARQVARAYLRAPQRVTPSKQSGLSKAAILERLELLSWPDMLSTGLVTKLTIERDSIVVLELSFAYIGVEELAEILLGPGWFARIRGENEGRIQDRHLMLVGSDGTFGSLFQPERVVVQQNGNDYALTEGDFILLEDPLEGKIGGQVTKTGVLFISKDIDLAKPFSIHYVLGPRFGISSSEYSLPADVLTLVQGRAGPDLPSTTLDTGQNVSTGQPGLDLTFAADEEENVLSRLTTRASLTRAAAVLSLFALVIYALLRKSTRVRWVALAYTFIYLGFIDGSFLSISHITSGITVGPAVYLNDLPLLLTIGFTATTTLVWGRVFCGFLCPFGALQDFLERAVPRRFQLSIPQRIHDRALYIKYGILTFVVALAIARSNISVFQYFEPFGTVFFLSPSVLLWTILAFILAASLVVPRFYCRYACPLGAGPGAGLVDNALSHRQGRLLSGLQSVREGLPHGSHSRAED